MRLSVYKFTLGKIGQMKCQNLFLHSTTFDLKMLIYYAVSYEKDNQLWNFMQILFCTTQMNRIVGSIPELKESSMKTLVCHDQTEAGDTKFQLQTLVCLGKVVDDIVAAAVKRLRTFDDIFERCKKLMSTLGSAEGSKMIKKFGNMCKDADTG